jgi:2-dehydro-3-deoxygluconokinase
MLRLKSPGYERLLQSPVFEASLGGAEANVAVSLAQWGKSVEFISAFPEGPIGDAAIASLRAFGVSVFCPERLSGRLGVYYLEAGSNQRPSMVIYDRAETAFSQTFGDRYDWNSAFQNAGWLHVSGISPALSSASADAVTAAVHAAHASGMKISIDLNYRKKLWNWGKTAKEVLIPLVAAADTLIANESDIQEALKIDVHAEQGLYHEQVAIETARLFPNLVRIAITLRDSKSADRNRWAALLYERGSIYRSAEYEIYDIVDRVGAGDAFAAGLIFSITEGRPPLDCLQFAASAGCLKHSIPGDFNRMSVKEIDALAAGNGSGRIQR